MEEVTTQAQVLEGTVSAVIYQNEENGYTILRLDCGEEETTVVGAMPGISPGEYLSVRGRWTRHPTYGSQFKAEVVERRLPQGLKEIYHYLASGAVKGVGKATARLLVEEFGEDVFQVIEDDPEQLTRIRGISPKRARQIGDVFRQQMGMQRLAEFLGEHGLPLELVPQLRRCYGDVALEALKAAGSTDAGAVKAALPDVTYTGVTGVIAFDDIGDAIRDTAYIKVADTANSAWALETMQKAG